MNRVYICRFPCTFCTNRKHCYGSSKQCTCPRCLLIGRYIVLHVVIRALQQAEHSSAR